MQKIYRLIPITLVLFSLVLSGCHFPQSTDAPLPRSAQKKTEVASILNPVGLETPTPTPTITPGLPIPEPIITVEPLPAGKVGYFTQQGDTLPALLKRFDVPIEEVHSDDLLPTEGLLPIGIHLILTDNLKETLPFTSPIFPDSEVVFGPSVGDFDAAAYAREAGGFLSTYEEKVKDETMSGPEIVQWVAVATSTNPRLLLAILEYQSGWVLGSPAGAESDRFPIGFGASDTGLYNELMITARFLAQGFYGWRDGSRVDLAFYGGGSGRLAPNLNAGSAALMHFFASIYPQTAWEARLFGEDSFLLAYQNMFGDPWSRAAVVEPYLTPTTQQPPLTLPIPVGEGWSLTGGPHITWQTGTPRGALDFAPITGEPPCAVSARWAVAAAPGLVVRSEQSVVALDLDGDGDEGTGWVLIYQHMAEKERVSVNTFLDQDDPVGHPSCEGGQASGTHVHFARKFNGEWIGVEGPLPMILSGWRAYAGEGRYEGFLQKGDQIVTNRPDGSSGSTIIRDE